MSQPGGAFGSWAHALGLQKPVVFFWVERLSQAMALPARGDQEEIIGLYDFFPISLVSVAF